MSRFTNAHGVVFSVDDSKDSRYTVAAGFKPYTGEPEPSDDEDGVPKGNASREEWASYADSLGVGYDAEAKRDDIKAAVAASKS